MKTDVEIESVSAKKPVRPKKRSMKELEAIIRSGFKSYHEMGAALLEIRDRRLYKKTHSSFGEYCKQKWDYTEASINRFIAAAKLASRLAPIGVPRNESILRPLVKLHPKQQTRVWQCAMEKVGDADKITHKVVSEAANETLGDKRKNSEEHRQKPKEKTISKTALLRHLNKWWDHHPNYNKLSAHSIFTKVRAEIQKF